MMHVRPDDKTATLGLDQSYRPLHIKEITIESGHPAMQSMWRPDADELAALNAGGVIVLNVLGRGHPPVHLTTWLDPSAGGMGQSQTEAGPSVDSQSPKPDRIERSAISPSPPPPTIRPDTGDA